MSEKILARESVRRVRDALDAAGIPGQIHALSDSTRTALEAATALGVSVAQIASSLVFEADDGEPVLIITSGAHRVDVDVVARELGVSPLGRVDAAYVKARSGFSIGGVAPVGWAGDARRVTVLIDEDLAAHDVIWAAAGHPHAVFPCTFEQLRSASGARVIRVTQA